MPSETKTYLVYNYNSSPVAVQTKYESHLIEGGSREQPSTMPFSMDELTVINSKSNAFKIGLLWFSPDEQERLYAEMRITNWENILRDEQIEEILLSPTVDSLQRLIEIENDAYFERVRGVFVGLKNSGADLSTRVQKVIDLRYKELTNRQRVTSIRLTPKTVTPDEKLPSREEVDALNAKLAAMEKMLSDMQKGQDADRTDLKDQGVKPAAEKKPATKKKQ